MAEQQPSRFILFLPPCPSPPTLSALKAAFGSTLAENLAHYEQYPHVFDISLRRPPPPLLRLPVELRQSILSLVISGNELLERRLKSTTANLALVCKHFRADVTELIRVWDKHEEEWRLEHGVQHGAFASLIGDLNDGLKRTRHAHERIMAVRERRRRGGENDQSKISKRKAKDRDGSIHQALSQGRRVGIRPSRTDKTWTETTKQCRAVRELLFAKNGRMSTGH